VRIFVTGATGVIGRRAVPMLTAAGHRVTAAGRNPARLAALEMSGARTVTLNLFDREAVRRTVRDHDVVVNLATHIPSTMRIMFPGAFRENDRVRREGSANLVDAALEAGVARYIQESFAPIYDDGGDRWLDESSPLRPVPYNRTVLDAERSAERFRECGGAGVVLRFALFYGPDCRAMLDTLPMLRRGIAPLPGRGDAYISAVSHDDAARAVITALEIPPGTYNVTDDEPLVRADYFAAFADAFGLPHPKPMPSWLPKLMGSLGELLGRSQRMSNAKLRACGWEPRYPNVYEGFCAMAAELRGASAPATGELRHVLSGGARA
jgi:nucleoside-diphosphate-sugar epimerase